MSGVSERVGDVAQHVAALCLFCLPLYHFQLLHWSFCFQTDRFSDWHQPTWVSFFFSSSFNAFLHHLGCANVRLQSDKVKVCVLHIPTHHEASLLLSRQTGVTLLSCSVTPLRSHHSSFWDSVCIHINAKTVIITNEFSSSCMLCRCHASPKPYGLFLTCGSTSDTNGLLGVHMWKLLLRVNSLLVLQRLHPLMSTLSSRREITCWGDRCKWEPADCCLFIK